MKITTMPMKTRRARRTRKQVPLLCVQTSSYVNINEKHRISHTALVTKDKNGDNELEKVNCLRQRKYKLSTSSFFYPLFQQVLCFHAKAIWNEIKCSSSACCFWFNFNNLLVEKRNQWKYHIYKQSFMQNIIIAQASVFKTNTSFYSLRFVWSRNPILFMFNVRVRKSLFSTL